MGGVKDLQLRVIPPNVANPFVRRVHYSGKVATTSTLHFGVFQDGALHGVMSFGNPMAKRTVIGLVEGTPWNGMLELNRMAFDAKLPRNSESRCLSVAMKLIRRNAPHVKWILSFADATECGDGTIYRAAGFILTGIKKNASTARLPDGTSITPVSFACTKSVPRKELGGEVRRRVFRDGQPIIPPVSGCCRRQDQRGVSAEVYLLHRQAMERPANGSRTSVLSYPGRWCRYVQRGKAGAVIDGSA